MAEGGAVAGLLAASGSACGSFGLVREASPDEPVQGAPGFLGGRALGVVLAALDHGELAHGQSVGALAQDGDRVESGAERRGAAFVVVDDLEGADLAGGGFEVVQGDGEVARFPGDEEDAARAGGDPGGAVDPVQGGFWARGAPSVALRWWWSSMISTPLRMARWRALL